MSTGTPIGKKSKQQEAFMRSMPETYERPEAYNASRAAPPNPYVQPEFGEKPYMPAAGRGGGYYSRYGDVNPNLPPETAYEQRYFAGGDRADRMRAYARAVSAEVTDTYGGNRITRAQRTEIQRDVAKRFFPESQTPEKEAEKARRRAAKARSKAEKDADPLRKLRDEDIRRVKKIWADNARAEMAANPRYNPSFPIPRKVTQTAAQKAAAAAYRASPEGRAKAAQYRAAHPITPQQKARNNARAKADRALLRAAKVARARGQL